MVERRVEEIDFRTAPKGSLEKYKAAILKDPQASTTWKKVMATSAAAVPDIDNLFTFARTFLRLREQLAQAVGDDGADAGAERQEEESSVEEESTDSVLEYELLLRGVSKAVASAVEERERLEGRAQVLLAQCRYAVITEKEGSVVVKKAVSSSTEALLQTNACLVVCDLASAPSPTARIALLLAAFVSARSQERLNARPTSPTLAAGVAAGDLLFEKKMAVAAVVLVNQRGGQVLVPIPSTAPPAAAAAAASTLAPPTCSSSNSHNSIKSHQISSSCSTLDGDDFVAFEQAVEAASDDQQQPAVMAEPLTAATIETAIKAVIRGNNNTNSGGGDGGEGASSSSLLSTSPSSTVAPPPPPDVLLLCASFPAGQDEPDDVTAAVMRCQQIQTQQDNDDNEDEENTTASASVPPPPPPPPLRALLVNRVKPTRQADTMEGVEGVGVVPFRPRPDLRPRPSDPRDVVVDLCVCLDLTGSMGSWMDAAKQHLTAILQGLAQETGVGHFRVAFVGYRDFRDEGRVVSHPFVPVEQVQQVVAAIAHEEASGGCDEPEDVFAGFKRASELDWQGHVRVLLHLADATAHGCTSGLDYVGDDYPRGTPDQGGKTLAQLCSTLKDPLGGNPGVDLLFCKLNDRTKPLEEMYAQVWNGGGGSDGGGGGGYGCLPMTQGAGAFKEAVLGALSEGLLGLMACEDAQGLQTFDGATLSATLSCLNDSFKESLQAVGKELLGDQKMKQQQQEQQQQQQQEQEQEQQKQGQQQKQQQAKEEGQSGDGAATTEAKTLEANPKGSLEAAEAAAAAAAAAVSSRESGGGRGGGEAVSTGAAAVVARSDAERLLADLEGEDLTPVRIALGLSAGSGSFTGGLALKSAVKLVDLGVKVKDLKSMGYPDSIVDVFVEAAAAKLARVA
jgi:hypothetical protein